MRSAQHIGSPVIRVPLTPALRVDVAAMGARAVGAGLIYICSPNNPTSSAVAAVELAAMVAYVAKHSPDTKILVDEAYFDYTDMAGFGTMIPLVRQYPQLIVTRTFSKIHGMAGMRVAYAIAQPRTLELDQDASLAISLGSMSLAAAVASLGDTAHTARVAALNRDVRASMVKAFTSAGYKVAPADANFVFVNIRRDAREFQEACSLRGVHIGRAFPPMSQWARISVGTRDEIDIAMEVFMDVLASAGRKAPPDVRS